MSSYSLPQTLAAFHSFYDFLTTLPSDITPASILTPPPSAHGWPSLTPHYLSPLRKTPAVTTLLQHLPYIAENPGTAGSTQIAYQTDAIDFRGPAARWSLEKDKIEGTMEPVGAGVIPEWVVCLSGGGRDASWLLLDTREGTITDFVQQERPERDEPQPDSPDFWRAYHTRPVVEFLEEWKDKYKSLEWVVVPDDVYDAVMIRRDEKTDVSCATNWSGFCFSAEAAFFSRGVERLADIVFSLFRGRRSELSIVTTAGRTIFVAMSADRRCWNGNGVISPRYPHEHPCPRQKVPSSPSYGSASFHY